MIERLSVRGRIATVATALAGLILLLVSVLIVRLVENDVRAAAQDALATALEEQAAAMGGGAGTGFEAGSETSFELVVDGQTYQLGLFDELSEGNATGELVVNDELTAVLEIDLRTSRVVAVVDPGTNEPIDDPDLKARLEQLTFEMLDLDGDQGSTFLVGASALAEIEASTAAIRGALMITVPLVVLGFGVVAWWLAGRALRPVMAITDQVKAISTTSLDQRVPVPAGQDEVAELAMVMNQMLGRLEDGDERQQQFSADASHELLSPLTTIRAAAEAIERRPESTRTRELAGHVVAETERMDSLIGDLLELARMSNGELLPASLMDLGQLVRGVVDGSDVEVVAEGDVEVCGVERQITRLIRNLVDNAQRHARHRVRVSVTQVNGVAQLAVEDDGPGVSEADRVQVFDRFTRLDSDRGRQTGGSGLGLALAKSIAERHRATITVDKSAELGGARFLVEIPLPKHPEFELGERH